MSKRELPEINAGSMADIAFLLLIFFLVTTTMEVDMGIFRKLPQKQKTPPEVDVKAKNVLEISINKNNELFVENETTDVSKLTEIALNFIDNGGGLDIHKQPCDWCKGNKILSSSEHPTKAIISVTADREANYATYVSVLDNINKAYTVLRNRLSKELYKTSYTELMGQLESSSKNKEEIIKKVKNIRLKYPQLISEAEIQH